MCRYNILPEIFKARPSPSPSQNTQTGVTRTDEGPPKTTTGLLSLAFEGSASNHRLDPDPFPVGDSLGDFNVVRRLGHGAFATVYEATSRPRPAPGQKGADEVTVALKQIHRRIKGQANEYGVGLLLDHPNVIR